jgi:hypothetical protein
VPSCVDGRYKQGERGGSKVVSPPSLTAAGEPHPLPMERTSLTVSVAVCASITTTHFSSGADGTGTPPSEKSTVSVPSC